MTARPVLYVLAGVNGAGKSSVGGHVLARAGLTWFNPDTFAREWKAATGCDTTEANVVAWQEGMRRLDEALARGTHHAFETTLGGRTVAARILAATATHDVLLWFCGLPSPQHHIARVKARVAQGGHDIRSSKIHERYPAALDNLIALLPHVARAQVYDNSIDVAPGAAVPDPLLVLDVVAGTLRHPVDLASLQRTPDWAKAVVESMLSRGG